MKTKILSLLVLATAATAFAGDNPLVHGGLFALPPMPKSSIEEQMKSSSQQFDQQRQITDLQSQIGRANANARNAQAEAEAAQAQARDAQEVAKQLLADRAEQKEREIQAAQMAEAERSQDAQVDQWVRQEAAKLNQKTAEINKQIAEMKAQQAREETQQFAAMLQQPQAPAKPPLWSEVESDPRYQAADPLGRLITYARWHDDAYNYNSAQPGWNEVKDEWNTEAAKKERALGTAARAAFPDGHFFTSPMSPDEARYRIAQRKLVADPNATLEPDIKAAYDKGPPAGMLQSQSK